MQFKIKSLLTAETMVFNDLDRNQIEDFMIDEWDVYVIEDNNEYQVYYNSASDNLECCKGTHIEILPVT